MNADRKFAGAMPGIYERLLVPMLFQPYADDLARRVAALKPARVLELAAGTGALTRAMASALPPTCAISATDLNPAMLQEAARRPIARPVEWRPADACELPFPDASFDTVVCQFGVMFFLDRVRAYAQARRVLAPGGTLLFNTWDAIENNDFAHEVTRALAARFPASPPRFLARTPHRYHRAGVIQIDLAAAGFAKPAFETLPARSRAASAHDAALAYCQGTPLRAELEAIDDQALDAGTGAAAAALARRFGEGAIEGRMQALVFSADK